MAAVLLVGCGKMGGALVEGWLEAGFRADQVTVVEPEANAAAQARERTDALLPCERGTHHTGDDNERQRVDRAHPLANLDQQDQLHGRHDDEDQEQKTTHRFQAS